MVTADRRSDNGLDRLREEGRVLKVPCIALYYRSQKRSVFRIENDRTMNLRRHNGLEAEFLHGVAENDSVVIHPFDNV